MTQSQTDHTEERVNIFVSYAHQDEKLLEELLKQLNFLSRLNLANIWYSRKIPPGGKWSKEIQDNLNRAHLILLLISADFISSRYCYEIEAGRALDRYYAEEAHVIPIILRPSHWLKLPVSRLQALPIDGKPITLWASQDEALLNVAQGVLKAVTTIRGGQAPEKRGSNFLSNPPAQTAPIGNSAPDPSPSSQEDSYLQQGQQLFYRGDYEQALHNYEKARQLDPESPLIYQAIGEALSRLDRLSEAFHMYKQALRLEAVSYLRKGHMLRALGEYDAALEAYDIALDLAPEMAEVHFSKGNLYMHIGQPAEAQAAYQQGRDLTSN